MVFNTDHSEDSLAHGPAPHRSAAAVVVQVHEGPRVPARPLFGVDEGFGKVNPVADVVAAAAPVELPSLVLGPPSLVRVAVARLELPLAAGAGQCVDHARRGDGVDERRFATAWERRGAGEEKSCSQTGCLGDSLSVKAPPPQPVTVACMCRCG